MQIFAVVMGVPLLNGLGYFGETPKGRITKFGVKKIVTLRYFPLADSVTPFSAVLELFAFESPIFGFCTFWGPNSRTDFGDGGPIFTKFQDMIAQSSAQNQFVSAFRKIAPFWNGRPPVGSGVDKNGSKLCGFDPL